MFILWKTTRNGKRIVAGPNAYICDECIAICNNIIEDENYDEETGYEDLKSEDIPTPAEIKQILDEYVIGQDDAKKHYLLQYIIIIKE